SIPSSPLHQEWPPTAPHTRPAVSPAEPRTSDAERRQLTVLFCDLVDSTALAGQLDPEEWREVGRAHQEACAEGVDRFEGHIAQYLGDGLLVYFGYPLAHEDDAQRAVRVGVHTGLVVVGEMGGGAKHELLALGETPNLAARLQSCAAPDTVVISGATYRLVQGLFACQDLGVHPLKGIARPIEVYRVLQE